MRDFGVKRSRVALITIATPSDIIRNSRLRMKWCLKNFAASDFLSCPNMGNYCITLSLRYVQHDGVPSDSEGKGSCGRRSAGVAPELPGLNICSDISHTCSDTQRHSSKN